MKHVIGSLVLVLFVLLLTAKGQVRIVQTNSGGDNIHLIDTAANKVVAEIKGVPINQIGRASCRERVYVLV